MEIHLESLRSIANTLFGNNNLGSFVQGSKYVYSLKFL